MVDASRGLFLALGPHDPVILVGARRDRNCPSAFLAVPGEVSQAGALAGPVVLAAAGQEKDERQDGQATLHRHPHSR